MKIEIWSDVMCPFCYIGKRNFEAALAQFSDRKNIEVEWKSFQLDPSIPEEPQHRKNIYQFVAAIKLQAQQAELLFMVAIKHKNEATELRCCLGMI